MAIENIQKQIINILEQKQKIPCNSLEEKLIYRYLDTGHVDSFGLIHFIFELEDTFQISLAPEETQSDEFRYPQGLAQIIQRKLNENINTENAQ